LLAATEDGRAGRKGPQNQQRFVEPDQGRDVVILRGPGFHQNFDDTRRFTATEAVPATLKFAE
jgi:hypothetical protein